MKMNGVELGPSFPDLPVVWEVLVWGGADEGFRLLSAHETSEEAAMAYTAHVRVMPNCPVRVETRTVVFQHLDWPTSE